MSYGRSVTFIKRIFVIIENGQIEYLHEWHYLPRQVKTLKIESTIKKE